MISGTESIFTNFNEVTWFAVICPLNGCMMHPKLESLENGVLGNQHLLRACIEVTSERC